MIAFLPMLLAGPLVPAPALGASFRGPVALEASAPAEDPVLRLRVWLNRQRRAGEVSPEARVELQAVVGELRILAAGFPERRADIDLALLDLFAFDVPELPAGAAVGHGGFPSGRPATAVPDTQRVAAAELDDRVRSDGGLLLVWLADEVLGAPTQHDAARRRAAAALLVGRHAPGTLSGLLGATRDVDAEVRALAVEALVGWREAAVHAFFLERLRSDDVPFRDVCRHLQAVGADLGPQALARVRAEVGRLYVSEDWRDAARAKGLVGVLDAENCVPILIEALRLWKRRGEEGRGSRRVQHEIVAELQRLSGRSIGARPERWMVWWSGVREGRIELAGEDGGPQADVTRAVFFGLRPVTDRVVFVVDRSGSMSTTFAGQPSDAGGTHSPGDEEVRTRFDEAVEQLFTFLAQSGADTRFGLVAFNHHAQRWRLELTLATPENLALARSWLARGHQPDGGTMLAEGVRSALLADEDFAFDEEKLEADTVIVLCDGEATGPPDWVRPVLEQATGRAQLLFHCVRIGYAGDGVLEALAEGSGGDFVRVDG